MAPSLENLSVGDVFVVLKENNLTPTKWPIAGVVEVDPGTDGLERVVTVKTATGLNKGPAVKTALLLSNTEL